MKFKWSVLLIVCLLAVSGVILAQGGLPDIDGITEQLQGIEANLRAAFGEYVQVLPVTGPTATPEIVRTPKTIVEQLLALDNGDELRNSPLPTPATFVSPLCPPDQDGCPDAITVPDGMTVTVNTYVSPMGDGYEVVYETIQAGMLYRRVVNHGPETWRERDWYIPYFVSPLVTPEIP